MKRLAIALSACLIGLLAACQSSTVAQPGPSAGAASAVATPSAAIRGVLVPSPSPVVMPAGVVLSAPSAGVVWVLVANTYLFRSLDRGDTWSRSASEDPSSQVGDRCLGGARGLGTVESPTARTDLAR